MANRRVFKKDISALCSMLAEDVFLYNILAEKPNNEAAALLMNKVIEMHFEYRQKAVSKVVKSSGVKATKYFSTVWSDFTSAYETLSEEIIQLAENK